MFFGLKRFERIKNEKFTPVQNTIYSAFDPELKINGQAIKFMLRPNDGDPFKTEHFKFLGRWIHYSLGEAQIKSNIMPSVLQDMQTIDNPLITGFIKLWLYQFYLLARTSWLFLIYDFDRSFARELQNQISAKLKQWAGIYRNVDNGLLFRAKENFGLGMTSIVDHVECMQLIKCELLKRSVDSKVSTLYHIREQKNANLKIVFKPLKNCEC